MVWGIIMFRNEFKKTFSTRTLLIILCVMLLDGVLIISGEIDNFTAEDYHNIFSSEEMQGNAGKPAGIS
jgi:hypothetical protein